MLVTALLVTACSSAREAAEEPTDDTTTTTAPDRPATTQGPEGFTGTLDEFYVVPDPLPPGDPGDLVRTQVVHEGSATTTLVMYRSVDATGRDRVVTGIVTVPTAGEPPADGYPVIALAPGTVGLASGCAMSRDRADALDLGVPAVRVVTDYIGMGPVGERLPYLSRVSEAHSLIDAARAARHVAGAAASNRVAFVGHSQGGHAALAARELAVAEADDLDVVGTVAVAPVAMLDRSYGDDAAMRMVTTLALYGLAEEHNDLRPTDFVSSEVAEAAAVTATGCLGAIVAALSPFAPGPTYWRADPAVTEPAASILAENDVGSAEGVAPVLLASGTADQQIVPARVDALFARLCEAGTPTSRVVVDGAAHENVVLLGMSSIQGWLTQRFADGDVPDHCA